MRAGAPAICGQQHGIFDEDTGTSAIDYAALDEAVNHPRDCLSVPPDDQDFRLYLNVFERLDN